VNPGVIAKITDFIGFAAAPLLDASIIADLTIHDRAIAPSAAAL
jgi:hypothetical protein